MMPEITQPEIVKPESDQASLEVMDSSAIEAIQRAEIDVAVATARRFKRDVALSLKTCRELALRNPLIASKCNYALPRGNKKLIGPSIHFARIVKYAWGHLNTGSQIIGANREYARVLGVCHDLQTNNREAHIMDWPVQPPHVPTDERWRDQINLAKRAGSAVVERNAIFGCIPMILFDDILEEAKLLTIGRGKSFLESRDNAVRQCKELKISQPMIYRALDISGLESITTDHLIWLHAALQSIREQAASVEELFGKEAKVTERARAPKKGEKGLDEPPARETVAKPDESSQKPAVSEPRPAAPTDSLFADTGTETGTRTPRSLAQKLESLLMANGVDKNRFFSYLNAAIGIQHVKDPKLQVLTYVDMKTSDLAMAVDNWDATLEDFNQWLATQNVS